MRNIANISHTGCLFNLYTNEIRWCMHFAVQFCLYSQEMHLLLFFFFSSYTITSKGVRNKTLGLFLSRYYTYGTIYIFVSPYKRINWILSRVNGLVFCRIVKQNSRTYSPNIACSCVENAESTHNQSVTRIPPFTYIKF